jgi:hypothetical protein
MEPDTTTAPESSPAPSGPTDTASIAANVIQTMEAEDQQSSEAETPAPKVDTRQATVTPAPVPELSGAAKFLLEQGHKLKKDDGRDTWLPAKTVEGMLDRYVKTHRLTWDGERSTIEQREQQARADLAEYITAIQGDDRAFMETLAKHDQRYQKYLTPAEKEAIAAAAEDDPEPKLDGTIESFNALRAWDRREVIRKAEALVKPLTDRDKEAKQDAEQAKAQETFRESARTQMAEAAAWPGFGPIATTGELTPFQGEVLAELQKDSEAAKAAQRRPTMTFRQAFLEVQARHLAEASDPAKVREQVIKDMNAAPRSTSITRTGAEVKASARRTTEEIARETIARMG